MSIILDGTGTNNVARFALGIRKLTYPKNLTLNMLERTYDVAELVPHERLPWSGEGKPPVGTVCEFNHINASPPWTVAEIGYIGEAIAVVKYNDGESALGLCNYEFRPIRTPEQIAADERAMAIDEMNRVALFGDCEPSDGSQCMARLYDAGYRKQVSE